MLFKDLLKKMDFYHIENNLEARDNLDIVSVKMLSKDLSKIHSNIIYVTDSWELYNNLLIQNPSNLFVFTKDKDNTFDKISDIFSEEQQLSKGVFRLMEALSSGKGLDYIVETGSALIGNPLFIRDINFNILGFTKDVIVNDRVWNELTQKGYQAYSDFDFLMKNGFIERVNKYDIPIYYQTIYVDDIKEIKKGVFEEIEVYQGYNYILHTMYDNDIKISRVWCKIGFGENVFGHLVVLNALKEFSEIDILLIKKLAEILALELQKNEKKTNITIQNERLIFDLLNNKITDRDNLNEKLKIYGMKYKKYLRLIVLNTSQTSGIGLPINYIKGLFYHVFGNIPGVLFDGNYIAIYSSETNASISETKINNLVNFAKDTGTHLGISRPFEDLLKLSKHYRQCLEAIKSGKMFSDSKFLYSYDDYILQDIFNICLKEDSLINFCHPGLLELLKYDIENNAEYEKTLYSYVMKFKNPSDLAVELNIHRNTLYYRLNKIEEIMKVGLDNMDTLYSIYFSFKILDFIKKMEGTFA